MTQALTSLSGSSMLIGEQNKLHENRVDVACQSLAFPSVSPSLLSMLLTMASVGAKPNTRVSLIKNLRSLHGKEWHGPESLNFRSV